ncbi:MAG: patatin-like phospholipase family protein [Thermoleophilaceae bacterium]
MTAPGERRRSLILAGGGLKVALQAGVLQVWLDEAGLEFDHVDGASGGVFNLAMLCQGMSGTDVADNWRGLPAHRMVQPNWRAFMRPLTGESMTSLGALRERIFPHWGLDLDAIRSSRLEATFNTYNFSRHELDVITPGRLTEDLLVSCVSLPMWFPPVQVDGDTYIDAVYISDANVEEAIRRGADEIWAIWTVSELSEWRGGFLGNYFGIIETAANGHFRRILRRIEESNAALERGEAGEFGRPIEVKLLRAEVPLHYLLNMNPDRFTQAVERGVAAAREWCAEEGIALTPAPSRPREPGARVRFDERLTGSLDDGSPLKLGLRVDIDDLDAFIADLDHAARVSGEVESPLLGGARPIEDGEVEVLADDGDFRRKRVRYRLHFHDGDGRPLTLAGERRVERGVLRQAGTLRLRIVSGHVDAGAEGAELQAEGLVRLGAAGVLGQLRSLQAEGPGGRSAALRRLGLLWVGGLWDAHAGRLLPVSPV